MFNFSLCTFCSCTYSWIQGHQTQSKEFLHISSSTIFSYSSFSFFAFNSFVDAYTTTLTLGYCRRVYDDVSIRVSLTRWLDVGKHPCIADVLTLSTNYVLVKVLCRLILFLCHHYLLRGSCRRASLH